ncbi:OLC1v1029476C1 [Oldenlandia corymbosa var. corymbosa]|uniref:OLC1v1029476C1 n=1 Tax=Oldenlandia corymbosa var. corymbosa TaxID=529605 RepID=A0AAV1CE92_OLDCO|nr:OLC1v1029476C1 [Oldenlandia corymbosa var. corymbosa]
MASPVSMTSFKIIFYIFLVMISISFPLKKCDAASEESLTQHTTSFHSVPVRQLSPSLNCKSTTSAGPTGKSTLKIVNRNGACYRGESSKLTLSQILSHDKSRVASIQSRLQASSTSNTNGLILEDRQISLPNKPGNDLGTGNYVVTVGLGTPKKDYTLILDTGSDLTWTQCQPCKKFCYPQNDPIFNPFQSSTYYNISCSSPQCYLLRHATGHAASCSGTTCVYDIQYGDESFSAGFLAKETVTLGTDVLPGFLFGCAQNNQGLYGNTDGLLGLGRSQISIVSQTAKNYGRVFSYCLPTWSGSNGYLSFGKTGYSVKTVKFTPFSIFKPSENFYSVDLVGISVGGKRLPVLPTVFLTAGTIIDSGTVVTRLPQAAYSVFRDTFKQQMKGYKLAPALSLLDTCYDFSGVDSVNVPKISFIFRGNVTVDLGANGILVPVSETQTCLAFAENNGPADLAIFGNIQQQTLQVVFDDAGRRLGFGPGGCS